jgi:hypothetical protein
MAPFRVSYVKHTTTYANKLYDVDGFMLLDDENKPVNIFTVKMKDMLARGKIVCYHKPGRPGYRYFCTSKGQQESFCRARQRGMTTSTTPYHVYPDEPGCVLPFEIMGTRSTCP